MIKIKKNVLFNITNEYPTFSKSLKKIADYILSNTAQPQYLSIHQLAEICDVSESSVFRLCQILGFNGYKEFKYALAEANSATLTDGGIDAYAEILPEDSFGEMAKKLQILGFNGYKEFKYALAEANSATLTDGGIDAYAEILPEDSFGEMAKKLFAYNVASINQTLQLIDKEAYCQAAKHLKAAKHVILPEDSFGEMAKKLFAYNVASINQTLQLIDKEAYCQAAKHLKAAKHVYCFGQGASGIMAQELWGRFITVSSNFSYITDPHLQTIVTANCDKDDVIVLFSYSGATQDGPRLLSEAKIRGAKTILITHYRKSFASEFADIILLCGSRETPKQTGSIAAKMAQLFVIDLLFNEFYRLNPIEAEEAIKRTSVAMETKLLHENSKK